MRIWGGWDEWGWLLFAGLEAPGSKWLEASWTYWLEASVTGGLAVGPLFGDFGGYGLKFADFVGGKVVGFIFPDAEGAHKQSAKFHGNGDGASDFGFFGGGLGDAGAVGLEITDLHGLHALGSSPGDSFAKGDALHLGQHISGDTGVGYDFQHLVEIYPLVQGASLTGKFLQDHFQYPLPVRVTLHLSAYCLQSITHGLTRKRPQRPTQVKVAPECDFFVGKTPWAFDNPVRVDTLPSLRIFYKPETNYTLP